MRTEKEMMNLICGIAKQDERIRAVYMNGSRANPKVPKDKYQDYDIVFVVTETMSFINDKQWFLKFGNPLLMQEPDSNDMKRGMYLEEIDYSQHYTWLMLFTDGSRVDLRIQNKVEADKTFLNDKLTITLLDKDGILPPILPPTDIEYHVQKPDAGEFTACCNELWWCLNNVAKGLARDELPYVMAMLNDPVRKMLDRMLEWRIGTDTDFSVSAGKMGKYFKKYLTPETYRRYCDTYSACTTTEIWKSVYCLCSLFHDTALQVAEKLGFVYNQHEEAGAWEYLQKVQGDEYSYDDK